MTRIGRYTLHAIETGRLRLDGGAMFGIIPKPLWSRRIAPDERNRIPLNMRCLLIEGEGTLVLVDNGLGDKYDEKFADIYGVDHARHALAPSLARAGFAIRDVTDVILTHLHFDHCGGSTRRNDDRLEVAFPNARFHVQRSHWEWAQNPNVREAGSFLKENLDPLAASGALSLVDGPVELLPDVHLHLVNGHTQSQQLVRVQGDGEALLFVADLFPTHSHLAPAWNMAYDVRPLVSIDEKAALLEEAVAGGWRLFFEHDPDVELADLEKGEKGIVTTNHRPLASW